MTNFDTVRAALNLLAPNYSREQDQALAALAELEAQHAALEAENKRLREALDEIAINTHDDTAERVARTALKEQP